MLNTTANTVLPVPNGLHFLRDAMLGGLASWPRIAPEFARIYMHYPWRETDPP